jgi:hypothetical protein
MSYFRRSGHRIAEARCSETGSRSPADMKRASAVGRRAIDAHQRSAPLCVAGPASNACLPFAAHSAHACSCTPAVVVNESTVVVNDTDVQKGTLKKYGGSRSDDWNNVVACQAAMRFGSSTPLLRREISKSAPPSPDQAASGQRTSWKA